MKTTFSFMAFALLAAQQAFAVQPTIQWSPWNEDFIYTDCGFNVRIQQTGTSIDISYTDTQGVFHEFTAYPQLKSVMTNVLTGKSIKLNISGPVTVVSNPDGSFEVVSLGVGAWAVDPDSLVADTFIPGLFYTQGRVHVFVDVNGFATVTRTGTKTALCPKLQ